MWSSARIACCKILGRKGGSEAPETIEWVAWDKSADLPGPVAEWEDDGDVLAEARERVCCASIKRSYSLPILRRHSRARTRKITPMQDPANIPLDVICHEFDRKPSVQCQLLIYWKSNLAVMLQLGLYLDRWWGLHESTVFQFHSIYYDRLAIQAHRFFFQISYTNLAATASMPTAMIHTAHAHPCHNCTCWHWRRRGRRHMILMIHHERREGRLYSVFLLVESVVTIEMAGQQSDECNHSWKNVSSEWWLSEG